MIKKILIGAGTGIAIASFATAMIAGAQTTTTTATTANIATPVHAQMLNVNASGKVLLRGTIASITSGVITVNGWGGVWTVNVGNSAQILPAAVGNNLTQFKAGDFVGVEGTVVTNANWTINATLVRDWTYRAAVTQEQQQNAQNAKSIRQGTPRDYVGTASNVSAGSFTLTVNGTADTVNVASGAEVVNRKWVTIPLASIQTNDSVRVYGVNASGTIAAQIVRDVTLPATATAR